MRRPDQESATRPSGPPRSSLPLFPQPKMLFHTSCPLADFYSCFRPWPRCQTSSEKSSLTPTSQVSQVTSVILAHSLLPSPSWYL